MASTAAINAVTQDYANILFRTGTTTEINTWATLIDAGVFSAAQVANSIATSSEAVNNVAPIVRLYQAAFNRAPDLAGLRAWVAYYDATPTAATLNTISGLFSQSTEFTNIYGSSNPAPGAFAAAMYQNILNRAPDAAGLTAWTNALAGGMSVAAALANFAGSAEFVSNSGGTITSWLSSYATTNAYSSTLTIGSRGAATVVAGSSQTLTTTVDTVSGAVNTIAGILDLTGTSSTYSLTDSIAPSAGAQFNLTIIGNATTATGSGYQASGVTTVQLKPVNNAAGTQDAFDFGGFSGLSTVAVASASGNTGTLTLASLPSGTTLQLTGNGVNENVTVLSGTSTAASSQAISLTGGGAVAGIVTLSNLAASSTVNITTSGTADSLVGLATNNKAKTVTVSGTGGLSIGVTTATNQTTPLAMDTSVTTFNASGETGNVTVQLAVGSSGVTATAGTGTSNTLVLSSSSSIGTTVKTTGFGTVLVNAGGNISVDDTNITATTLGNFWGSSSANTVTHNNVASTVTTLQFQGADAANGTVAFAGLTENLTSTAGTADAVTINVNNAGVASTGTFNIGTVTANGLETITVNTADVKTVNFAGLADVNATNSTSWTISGTSNVNITGGNDPAALTSFNAGGLTGNLTATLANANGNLTFTGSSGTNVITLNENITTTGKIQTFNTGAGNDTYTFDNLNGTTGLTTFASTLNVNFGNGNDTFYLGATTGNTVGFAAGGALNVSFGSGTDSFVITSVNSLGNVSSSASGTIVVTGGTGTDTLIIGANTGSALNFTLGNSTTPGFSGFSAIQFQQAPGGGTGGETLNLFVSATYSAPSGFTVTDVSNAAGTFNTLDFFAPSGGSVSVANLTWLGNATATGTATAKDILMIDGTLGGSGTLTGSSTVSTYFKVGTASTETVTFGATHVTDVVLFTDLNGISGGTTTSFGSNPNLTINNFVTGKDKLAIAYNTTTYGGAVNGSSKATALAGVNGVLGGTGLVLGNETAVAVNAATQVTAGTAEGCLLVWTASDTTLGYTTALTSATAASTFVTTATASKFAIATVASISYDLLIEQVNTSVDKIWLIQESTGATPTTTASLIATVNVANASSHVVFGDLL